MEDPSPFLLSRYLDELTSDVATVHDNAETRWEELSNFSPEEGRRSLPASPIVGSSVDHTTTGWNPYGDGNLHQIWGSDAVPSTRPAVLETQERSSSSQSRTTVTEWNPYGDGSFDQTWGPDDTQAASDKYEILEPIGRQSSSLPRAPIQQSADSHLAESDESQREPPRLPSPETLSSLGTSLSSTEEPRPSLSDSVPEDVEPSRQLPSHPTVQDSLRDSGNQHSRSTRSFGGLVKKLQASSAPQDVPAPPATMASKVFGVALEESMGYASVEVVAVDNSLLSHGVSRTVRGRVPIVVGQCLKFLRAKGTLILMSVEYSERVLLTLKC